MSSGVRKSEFVESSSSSISARSREELVDLEERRVAP